MKVLMNNISAIQNIKKKTSIIKFTVNIAIFSDEWFRIIVLFDKFPVYEPSRHEKIQKHITISPFELYNREGE